MSNFSYSMFSIVPVIIIVGFIAVFAVIIVGIVRNAKEWSDNNNSPEETADAEVVAKRADVSHYHHNTGDDLHHNSSSTTYFVTFEFSDRSRKEFKLRDKEYGMLVEGDKGRLKYQGTRYLGFERIK